MADMRTPKLIVAKDGTETWKVRYRDRSTGRPRESSQTFASSKAADRFAGWINNYGAERAVQLLEQAAGTKAAEVTVAEWCRTHIDSLSGITEGTARRYRGYVNRDLGALGELPLSAVTPETVGAWVNKMSDAGSAGKTIANRHGFLSAAMNRAVDRGKIDSNPCRGTRLPETIREPMVFLTHEEYTRFLDCFTPFWRPMIETMFGTGLRWGEITALRIGDLDLDASALSVVQAWKYTGKTPVLGPPKSRKSRRTITLAPETVTVLRQAIDGRGGGEYVFVNHAGGWVKSGTFHNNVWQPAVRLANADPIPKNARARRLLNAAGDPIAPLSPPMGKRPRIHDARHTCASWLLLAGVPINYVQAHLGHESVTTTVDRYGHIMPAGRAIISQAMSAALSASRPELLPQSRMYLPSAGVKVA